MAISVGDAIVKISGDTKDLDKALSSMGDKVQSAMQKMQNSLRATGIAFTALGAAGLKMVDSAREINAQLGSTAVTLGKTTSEMRDLTLAVTDVTFSIKSVVATFDLLARAGVRSEEQLRANAKAFDSLGDATGSSAEVVASILIPALKAMGEELPQTAEDLDKFTWLAKNTTTELAEFGSVMDYVAMYGENLNVSLDDMIAIMAVLESKGKGGATATRLFRTAVNQAKDGTVTLNEALGVTQKEIDGYRKEIKAATGLTQKHADAMNEQYGFMDKLKHQWDKLTLAAGSFLTPLEPILAGMTALGPLMIFLGTSAGTAAVKWGLHTVAVIAHKVALLASAIAMKAVAAAQWLLNAAMAANPIGLVILAIGTLVGVAIGLKTALDKVTSKTKAYTDATVEAWKATRALTEEMRELERITKKVEWAEEHLALMQAKLDQIFTTYRGTIEDAIKAGYGLVKVQGETLDATEGMTEANIRYALTLEKNFTGLTFSQQRWCEIYVDAVKRTIEADKEHMEVIKDVITDIENATEAAISGAEQVADAEKRALDDRAQYYREFQYERMDLIDEQMMAEIRAVDPVLAAELEGYNKRIAALGEADEKRNARIEKDRLRELKEELEHGEDLTGAQRRELKDRIADVEDRWEKERLIEERNLKLSELNMDSYFESQKSLVDSQLEVQIAAYNTELEAFKRLNTEKLEDFKLFIEEYNRLMESLGARPREVEIPAGILSPQISVGPPTSYQGGGLITEPTLLYGLRSLKPYAIAGERGIERVSPAGAATNITNNFNGPWFIREEADVYRIAKELKTLQDRTERRVGLRGG